MDLIDLCGAYNYTLDLSRRPWFDLCVKVVGAELEDDGGALAPRGPEARVEFVVVF